MTFTTQPPTRAGAYWYVDTHNNRTLAEVYETLDCELAAIINGVASLIRDLPVTGQYPEQWAGPLVPASEVKKAYADGAHDIVAGGVYWLNSHARKVVEGEA
jgi:hypothetical protein